MRATRDPGLEFCLHFLNANLDALAGSDTLKLAAEMAGALGFDIPPLAMYSRESQSIVSRLLGPDGKGLKVLQEALRHFFLGAMDQIDSIRTKEAEMETEWHDYKEASGMRALTKIQTNIETTLEIALEEEQDLSWGSNAMPVCRSRWRKKALKGAVFRANSSAPEDLDALKYKFVLALDGIPISSVRKCPECKSWFIHTSKRERIFCSNKCASKSSNRDRYQKTMKKPIQASEGRSFKAERPIRKLMVKKD